MATEPTTEEMERIILDIYEELHVRSGEMLLVNTLRSKIIDMGYRMEDFQRGMGSLIEKEHVKEENNSFFLTDSGFKEM